VLNVRFQGGMHLTATLRQHLICFQWPTARQLSFGCRIAGRALSHQPPAGSPAICPAGIDCAADADGSVDAILVAIDPGQLDGRHRSAAAGRTTVHASGNGHSLEEKPFPSCGSALSTTKSAGMFTIHRSHFS
jgi:hypothetical protein